MSNEKITKIVDRLVNVDQKDSVLATNLHENWVKEHNLKEDFQIFLKNEEKLLNNAKFGPLFKMVLDEIKEGTKNIDMINLKPEDIEKMNEVKDKCNNYLSKSRLSIEEVAKPLKEPFLTNLNIEDYNRNKNIEDMSKYETKLNWMKENSGLLNNKLFIDAFTDKKNPNIKALEGALKEVGLELSKSEDSLLFKLKGENVYIGIKDDVVSFSGNKNVKEFNDLSSEQKEKYIMEAKLIKSILKDEIDNGAPLSQEEITKRVNDSYESYFKNYNKDMNFEFNDKVANSLVDKLKEQLLDTLSPDLKEQVQDHLSISSTAKDIIR